MFDFHNEPAKSAYKVYLRVVTVCYRRPYNNIASRIAYLRPRSAWSAHKASTFRIIQWMVSDWFATGLPPAPGHDPEQVAASGQADAVGFLWVPPIANELIVGEVRDIAQLNSVEVKKTCVYWLQSDGISGKGDHEARPDEKVILYFHGGGYITSSAHPQGGPTTPICKGLLAQTKSVSHVFSCEYRLTSSHPYPATNPFPATLFDALAGYHYLIRTVGVHPENVIVLGDSADGHLTISLIQDLAASKLPDLPCLGAAILLSPTVEWEIMHDGRGVSVRRNASSDYSVPFLKGYTKRGLLGNLPPGAAGTNAWISPASLKLPSFEGLFAGFLRTYLVAGEAEIMLDVMRMVRDRLIGDIGEGKMKYDEVKDATHDFCTMSWHEPERTQTFKAVSAWVDSL